MRGSGYGLRLTLFTLGSVIGPLLAVGIMLASGGDMRLVFWVAAIPAFLSVAVLIVAVKEPERIHGRQRTKVSLRGLRELPALFWWLVALTAILELARFSQVLLLKAKEVGVDAALIPTFLMRASRLRTFRDIAMPLVWKGILVGGLFSFIMSIQEAWAAIFLTLGGWEMIPFGIFTFHIAGSQSQAAAFGVILIVVCAVCLFVVNRSAGTRAGGLFG